jgi:catechol 2,3-dioxygenase-like lactoylglutathione lyase family enzyme
MDMKLEVVMVPVSDVDRAKEFYQRLGFREDIDLKGEGLRLVQFTPPGSHASIFIGTGITTTEPGSLQGLVLIVDDIDAAYDDLVGKGIDAVEVFHDGDGLFYHVKKQIKEPGRHPEDKSYFSYTAFTDPDGNGWIVQEVKDRLPGRV